MLEAEGHPPRSHGRLFSSSGTDRGSQPSVFAPSLVPSGPTGASVSDRFLLSSSAPSSSHSCPVAINITSLTIFFKEALLESAERWGPVLWRDDGEGEEDCRLDEGMAAAVQFRMAAAAFEGGFLGFLPEKKGVFDGRWEGFGFWDGSWAHASLKVRIRPEGQPHFRTPSPRSERLLLRALGLSRLLALSWRWLHNSRPCPGFFP